MKKTKHLFLFITGIILASGCTPDQYCYRDEECPSPMICKSDGSCDYICQSDSTCGKGFECKNYKCVIKGKPTPTPSCGSIGCACTSANTCDSGLVCTNQKCAQSSQPSPICQGDECQQQECQGDECQQQECQGDECQQQECQGEECPECSEDKDCKDNAVCRSGKCRQKTIVTSLSCPENMSLIEDTYCIDQYEASRQDATADHQGTDTSKAISQKGVMPWNIGDDNEAAEQACKNSGKHLCTPSEWEFSCHGINDTVYGYGDTYDPQICNGLDTFGRSGFHLMPTGSFENCHNGWGVYDMSGNLWEHTADGSAMTVRGGAFNCVDSEGNHRCSYIPRTWTPLSIGFRCCTDPIETTTEIIEGEDVPEAWNLGDGLGGHEVLLAQNLHVAETPDTMSDATPAIAPPKDDNRTSQNINEQAVQILHMDDSVPSESCLQPNDYIQTANYFWEDPDTARQAVSLLKTARQCHPDNIDIQIALGIAYYHVQNMPWALKTLTSAHQSAPGDCRILSWLSWIYLQMGMSDKALKSLQYHHCSDTTLDGRLDLVGALNALSNDDSEEAGRLLNSAYDRPTLSESDSKAMSSLQVMAGRAVDPNFAWKLEIAGGYASNAISGSPNDPRLIDKNMTSAFLDGELRLTLDPWKRAFARAVFEGQVNGQYLFSKDASDYSYVDIALRPGVVLNWGHVKFGTYFRPEFLILKGGDIYNKGPLLNYTSHRIEFDLEIHQFLYLFGGYGHRTFRQRVRTRDEADIGLGGYHPLGAGFALTWGATYRHWFSVGDMYDINGTNVSLALDYQTHDVLLRLSGSYAFDDYADSKGYFDADHARRDHLARGTFQIWSPSIYGLRFGGQFKASRRWSSAKDYSFDDYRGSLLIRWTGDLDFYSPGTVPDDTYALPWDLQNTQSTERIRDIIRQDEDMQRTSSCLQN